MTKKSTFQISYYRVLLHISHALSSTHIYGWPPSQAFYPILSSTHCSWIVLNFYQMPSYHIHSSSKWKQTPPTISKSLLHPCFFFFQNSNKKQANQLKKTTLLFTDSKCHEKNSFPLVVSTFTWPTILSASQLPESQCHHPDVYFLTKKIPRLRSLNHHEMLVFSPLQTAWKKSFQLFWGTILCIAQKFKKLGFW